VSSVIIYGKRRDGENSVPGWCRPIQDVNIVLPGSKVFVSGFLRSLKPLKTFKKLKPTENL